MGRFQETIRILWKNRYATFSILLSSLIIVVDGYDIGVISGAQLFVREELHLDDVKVEVMVGALNLFAIVGAILAGLISNRLGRRRTLMLSAALFTIGSVIMGISHSFPVLFVGRLFAGVAAGHALVAAPIYASEIAPPEVRGFLASLTEIFMGCGILLGYISNIAFASLPGRYNWRVMLGLAAVPAVVIWVAYLWIPETPRWLVMKGRIESARLVLQRTFNDSKRADSRLEEIQCAADVPHPNGPVWGELLLRPSACVRRILLAAVGVNFFQQACGIQTVTLYAPKIFKRAGLKKKSQALAANSGVGVTKVVFIFVSMLLADRWGRRPLLLLSIFGMSCTLLVLSGSLFAMDRSPSPAYKWIAIVMAWIDEAFYGIGVGPLAWAYASEIFPLRLRGPGMSMAVMVNRIVGSVVSMTFLSLTNAITIQGCYLMFSCISFIGGVFFWFALPETKGKTLEEVEALFEGKKPSEINGEKLEKGGGIEGFEGKPSVINGEKLEKGEEVGMEMKVRN
ncbi:probable polyol transporter 6 [Amborella trichopoda]|uniref:Major facilitator superfamily (MFS) profile domain-containing protein n=1 Tax=Amborella trichopoda TaxID=13333 RepID=U5D554_AMBTC|nr:probable polyol transporter 6 [Amborella trichopoda]ERN17554.1 hypothetical protein AMTR_s00059p00124920 [Amborella trichopoda]|eukprot:XP_011627761.2 probable polyol transporter 6 [Amborella trichopoda]